MLKKNFLFLLLCTLISRVAYSETHKVTRNEALEIAQRQFEGRDVDYYYLDNNPVEFVIFVDAQPMMNWEHECYTLTIPKVINTDVKHATPSRVTPGTMPPSYAIFQPLSVKSRSNNSASEKPVVRKAYVSGDEKAAAERTYALIISGGISPLSNYERYWNDCSFIYQSLVNMYGVPKENIYPIMADGNSPGKDMHSLTGEYVSQPLDLDNDGVDDIKLAATYDNIRRTLLALKYKLNKDDHLFIYVIDHGGTTDYNKESYICLWGEERLTDNDLADMLAPFTEKFVNVNVVLGQCFSGGFIDDLTKVGCVVATASAGSESSWACSDIPYDEFVYHWTCAVTGADHKKHGFNTDRDRNGYVTMDDAFAYAKDNDRANEHPQYVSTPKSLGESLAFDKLAPSVDLYIKDNPEDIGKERNTTIKEYWRSPSICVRNEDDDIFEHQNPEYSNDHRMAFIYVRVHNRGKEPFYGEGKWVHIYWVQASTGITTKAWKGREIYENRYATGGTTEASPIIDTIYPGESRIVKINWTLPNMLTNYPEGNFHFCLLAKIMDTPYDDGYVDGKSYFNILGSNDQAQKNVTIVRKKDLSKGFNVYVRNTESTTKEYTLELIPHTVTDSAFYSRARVEMEMSPKIYSAWERGGLVSKDVEILESNSNASGLSRCVRFISPHSILKRISLNGNEFDIVKLKFSFDEIQFSSTPYTFDLVQKDEDGNIIGGETFVVESPAASHIPIQISNSPLGNGQFKLEVDTTEFETFRWVNSQGENISESETVVVFPKASDNSYTVFTMSEEGDVATDQITLDKQNGIEAVSMTGTDNMEVSLYENAPANSEISITSVMDGTTKMSHKVSEGSAKICLKINDLHKGVYIVCYHINSEIVDQVTVKID